MDNNQPPDNGDESVTISWSALSDLIEQSTGQASDPQQPIPKPTGSVLRAISSERKMKVYLLPENELKFISLLNSQAIIFASVGAALLSFILAILIDAIMEFGTLKGLKDAAAILVYYFAPMFGFVSLVFFGLCAYALVTRLSMLSIIKSESVATEE